MRLDLEEIVRAKREHRKRLAALPIADKLRLLDAMRERELAIRAAKKRAVGGRQAASEPRG